MTKHQGALAGGTIKCNSCDDCKSNIRKYADGMVLKNFSKFEEEDMKLLGEEVEVNRFYTYWECKKNKGKLQYLNLSGDCKGFSPK